MRKLLLLLGIAASGCAFHAPEEKSLAQCQGDGDCGAYRRCNPITSTCELQPPEAKDFVLAGPFDCEWAKETYSGVDVAAQWPPFTDSSNDIPGVAMHLSHFCWVNDNGPDVALVFFGARHASASFGRIGFYTSFLSWSAPMAKTGTRSIDTTDSGIYFCPAYSLDVNGDPLPYDPYYNRGLIVTDCTQLFVMPHTDLTVLNNDGKRFTGYVSGALVPQVIPPTGGM